MNKPLLIVTAAAFLAAAIVASHAAEVAKPAPTPAAAAPAAPAAPVLPVVLTPDDLKGLQDYLVAQPFSFASPLINFLAGKEAAAQAEAAKAKK